MKSEWNLDILYKGLEDPAYEKDVAAFQLACDSLHDLIAKAADMPLKERIEALLTCMENQRRLNSRLSGYLHLRLSTNAQDGKIMSEQNRLSRMSSACAADQTAARRILGDIPDVDALAEESDLVSEYSSFLKRTKEDCSYLLSDEAEAMASAMDMTGGSAWGQLQSYLTSTLKVDYDGGQVTLSQIRNLAYSPDPAVRKAAYEAELASYEKIQDSVAFSLNNLKNQVSMLCEKRGYGSALALSLKQARMSRQTLDAMMEAITEYLPVFVKYFRKKGELLGHTDGLPWYDLFAPLGKSDKIYSLEECRDYLLTCFGTFTPQMSDLMQEAFDHEWIDFYPRDGKRGGAFCSGLTDYRQSRILTNYDGSFSAVDTLAHELGHAFHNRQMENERLMNRNSPMPVAETASTFNEVFLGAYAMKQASSREERLALLENDLREKSQCVVDIYSRYLFESAVFEQSRKKFLMAGDLKQLMLDAQEKAYGAGLAADCRHPYMWICKSHYYRSGLSFYNFPYAFGNLFAQGLYTLYCKEGDAFIPRYKEMLRTTSVHTIEEDGALLGIDLTKKEFWEDSLKSIAAEIEEFCAL
ncbi:MAG: M3 family oligoendopeptidase [Lachnospiraceae bacterium]|nr:M3 family oligoendopeptidase [Lachnospiraceae bacterium]